MGGLHQLDFVMGYKFATHLEQYVEWLNGLFTSSLCDMGCKSATSSQQYVESVIYINLILLWDTNLPPPLNNILHGVFTLNSWDHGI